MRHIRCRVNRVHLHHFEVGRFQRSQIVQIVVIPAIVRRAADVHRATVIRHDHAVLLHCGQDDFVRCRKS